MGVDPVEVSYPLNRGKKRLLYSLARDKVKPLVKNLALRSSIKETPNNMFSLEMYQFKIRGLQRRNFVSVQKFLLSFMDQRDINVIATSWLKFKLATALRPSMKKTYTWIMKNFSSLEGQKKYEYIYERCLSTDEKSMNFFKKIFGYSPQECRLMDYFYNEDKEWILPVSIFPLISFNKNKMEYCYKDFSLSEDLQREFFDLMTKYLVSLDVKSIHVPRPDCLAKIGNQRFNDLGQIKFDYERATSISDISFLYQVFMTKNLSPREVWVPSKIIKWNNLFLMKIYRQLLEKDPAYPPIEVDKVNDQLSNNPSRYNFFYFDLPGYGFQYPRMLLDIAQKCIEMLYPCTDLSEQSQLFYKILEQTKVILPSGEVVRPTRGIGLGYYEDLKTLIILAILWNRNWPISMYGDQGLMSNSSGSFKEDLEKFGFIYKDDPDNRIRSDCFGQGLLWAGYIFKKDEPPVKPTEIISDFLDSFLCEEHWERKNSLRSLFMRREKLYKRHFLTLCSFYKNYFGFEFFKGDYLSHFDDGGINYRGKIVGLSKLYNLRSFMTPKDELLVDVGYTSPFLVGRRRRPPVGESRLFSKKRKMLYKNNVPKDTQLYDYIYPLLEYNNKDVKEPTYIPRWADYQQIIMHGMTSGSFTCGLQGEEIRKAVLYQHFSPDPFRARATGGYSFKTTWRSSRPAPSELVEMADYLVDLMSVSKYNVNRADLHQTTYMSEDPLYFSSDLLRWKDTDRPNKRTVDNLMEDYEKVDHVNETYKRIKSLLQNKERVLPSTFISDRLLLQEIQYEYPQNDDISEYGEIEDHILFDEFVDNPLFDVPNY